MKTRFVMLALVAVCFTPALADKVTVDPNTAKAATQAKQAVPIKADPRLEQKVNYVSTNKRLHTVIEDIAEQTGVTIYCGKTKDDWQVRDLPLVVCSNDLPLGDLLRYIADATHLALTPSTVKNEKCYRIWRDYPREQQLADYYKRRTEAHLARANWEWDSLVKVASLPDPKPNADEMSEEDLARQQPEVIKDYARILAALPAGSKEKVFAGEKLTLKAKDLPQPLSGLIEAMYRDRYRRYQQEQARFASQSPGFTQPEELTEDEVKGCCLTIELPSGETPMLYPTLHSSSPTFHSSNGFNIQPACDTGAALGMFKDKLPERPKDAEPPQTSYAPNLEKYVTIYSSSEKPETFKIEKPTDKRVFTVADYIAAFAKASGYSIICEDFESHKRYGSDNLRFGSDVEFSEVVQSLRNGVHNELYTDKNSKLLVGSAWGWYAWHKRLAPESVLIHLKEKLDGDGAELDDATMIRSLPDGASWDWIMDSRDLSPVNWGVSEKDEPFWKLYDALSSADKALANSESGLPLIKLDSDYTTAVFRKAAQGAAKEESRDAFTSISAALQANQELNDRVTPWLQQWFDQHYPGVRAAGSTDGISIDMDALSTDLIEQFPQLKTSGQIPTDANVISKLTLRILKRDMQPFVTIREETNGGYRTHNENRPDGFKKHAYRMTIQGDGINLFINGPGLQFPVYSPEREAELWKEMQKPKGESKSPKV